MFATRFQNLESLTYCKNSFFVKQTLPKTTFSCARSISVNFEIFFPQNPNHISNIGYWYDKHVNVCHQIPKFGVSNILQEQFLC